MIHFLLLSFREISSIFKKVIFIDFFVSMRLIFGLDEWASVNFGSERMKNKSKKSLFTEMKEI